MTGQPDNVFNRQRPPKGKAWVIIGDGTAMKHIFVRILKLTLYGDTDVDVQMSRAYLVDGLEIDLFSLHAVQAKHTVPLD